jgi:hypothetical protein
MAQIGIDHRRLQVAEMGHSGVHSGGLQLIEAGPKRCGPHVFGDLQLGDQEQG